MRKAPKHAQPLPHTDILYSKQNWKDIVKKVEENAQLLARFMYFRLKYVR